VQSLTASQELRALGKPPKPGPAPEPGPRDSGPARDSASSGGAAPEKPSPDTAYGPDDPGYGPPDHDWYERRKRERALEMEREEEEFLAEAAEETPPKPAPAPAPGGPERRPSQPGSGAAEETSLETFLKSDDGSDVERDPLGRVRDLYLAVEKVGDSDLDRHLEDLLERQRGLIGAYLSQSRPEMPDGPAKRAG